MLSPLRYSHPTYLAQHIGSESTIQVTAEVKTNKNEDNSDPPENMQQMCSIGGQRGSA